MGAESAASSVDADRAARCLAELGMPREEGERLVRECARMVRAYLRSVLAASD